MWCTDNATEFSATPRQVPLWSLWSRMPGGPWVLEIIMAENDVSKVYHFGDICHLENDVTYGFYVFHPWICRFFYFCLEASPGLYRRNMEVISPGDQQTAWSHESHEQQKATFYYRKFGVKIGWLANVGHICSNSPEKMMSLSSIPCS